MKTALVTGATGFVGWHVAKLLKERGVNVRALSRSGAIPELDVEPVSGDLRDPATHSRAATGSDHVKHVAAD